MSDIFDTEVWLPDPIERCQDALRLSWSSEPAGDCWYLSRSAIERFFQEDAAGNSLPDEWRKLLVIANLPRDSVFEIAPELRFSAADFEELKAWSGELGPRLDLSNEEVEVVFESVTRPVPPLRTPTVRFAFVAVTILASLTGLYAYMNEQITRESTARLAAERRYLEASSRLAANESALQNEKRERLSSETKLALLTKANEALRHKANRIPSPPAEIVGVDLGPLTVQRNAGSRSAWDARSPAFVAVRRSPNSLSWPKGRSGPATAQIFDSTTQKKVWSHTVDLAAGLVSQLPTLPGGKYYEWSVVTESGEDGFSSIPFYVLSSRDLARLGEAMKSAKSEADKASLLVRFGLLDELIPFTTSLKRHLALD